jgi:hypothetical protein
MRSTWVLAVAGVIYGAEALAGDSPPVPPAATLGAHSGVPATPGVLTLSSPPPAGKVVYLYTTAQLEQLRKDNPKHYAQAERILAAGSKLCAPGADSLIQIGLNVHDLQCNSMALRTSLPPKVDIRFRLDDTVYIARVAVTNAQANAVKVKSP